MVLQVHCLTSAQIDAFHRDGFLLIPGFYDVRREIEPIQRAIYQIIGLVIEKYGLEIPRKPFHSDTFDDGYQSLIAANRRYGAEVYDAVKQIPAFIRLLASEKHEQVVQEIRGTDLPGIAAQGYGIRIDNPNEEKFRAPWHQDYPAQLRSLDGLVFWSPLVPLSETLGPVRLCVGSHQEGPVPVYEHDPKNPDKSGAYSLILEREEERVSRYPVIAPLLNPGDLLLVDFLTLHASGVNVGDRSRWSMQMRYFNFNEPTGIEMGWCGSFAAGVKLRDIHPDLVLDA